MTIAKNLLNMMKAMMLCCSLVGCTTGLHLPKLLGPAEELHCTLDRTGGAMVGTYACNIEGKYQMYDLGM